MTGSFLKIVSTAKPRYCTEQCSVATSGLSLARRTLKDKFPTPTVPLTVVLPNRPVFLPDPMHLHFMLDNGLRSHPIYSCFLYVLSYIKIVCNEELNDLYSLPNFVRVVKSRRMRWAGHVARMGGIEWCTGCWGSLMERGHWGDKDVDGWIIWWIFRKLEGLVGTGWIWLRIGTGGGHLWVRWGTFGFHKCVGFLD